MEYLEYIVCFFLFTILQSLAINGMHESMKGSALKDDINNKINYQGNILYMISPRFFEKYKYKYWSKPLFSCVKCMASVYGALTYWPIMILLFGFNWFEVLVFVWDIPILVSLNYWIYKKL